MSCLGLLILIIQQNPNVAQPDTPRPETIAAEPAHLRDVAALLPYAMTHRRLGALHAEMR